MNIKNLLLGSVATLVASSQAQASATPATGPKHVEYVRVCDAYGAGYFYIPGTETCLRLSGNINAATKFGGNVDAISDSDLKDQKTYDLDTSLTLVLQTASETELGTLRSYASVRSRWSNGKDSSGAQLRTAYVELGGFRVGLDNTIFASWTGGYGKVLNDSIVAPSGDVRTNFVSYTLNADSGFSAIVGAELGNATFTPKTGPYYYIDENDKVTELKKVDNSYPLSKKTKNYIPNVVFGAKFAQSWGGVSAVTAYDSYYKKWAAKARLDFNVNDRLSVWAMGGYKNNVDYYLKNNVGDDKVLSKQNTTIYANWGGKWAAWTGGTYKINSKTRFNAQIAYSAAKTFATSLNIAYTLVPGLVITPELTFVSWRDNRKLGDGYVYALDGKNALQAKIQLRRSF